MQRADDADYDHHLDERNKHRQKCAEIRKTNMGSRGNGHVSHISCNCNYVHKEMARHRRKA